MKSLVLKVFKFLPQCSYAFVGQPANLLGRLAHYHADLLVSFPFDEPQYDHLSQGLAKPLHGIEKAFNLLPATGQLKRSVMCGLDCLEGVIARGPSPATPFQAEVDRRPDRISHRTLCPGKSIGRQQPDAQFLKQVVGRLDRQGQAKEDGMQAFALRLKEILDH